MKTPFILPLAMLALTASASTLPLDTPPAAAPQAATHPTMQALGSLSDADCVALESYLLQASRVALLAYADAFEQALKTRDRSAFTRLVQGGQGSTLAAAMASVPTGELPADFRSYLPSFFALMQQIPQSREEARQLRQQQDALLRQYPGPAACLPPESILMVVDEACRNMKNDLWTQRGTMEGYVAELREIAEALPRSMEAAAARHTLTRQALRRFDSIQPAMVAFGIGQEQIFSFPSAAGLPYGWQLAGELPADAPVSVSWSEERAPLISSPGSGEELERCAAVKGLRAGKVTLQFVFTRPGDAAPLFTRDCEVEVYAESRDAVTPGLGD